MSCDEHEAGEVRFLTKQEAEQEDRAFWHSKTPAERLAAAELLRQAAYGYDPTTARIQEVIEVAELKRQRQGEAK